MRLDVPRAMFNVGIRTKYRRRRGHTSNLIGMSGRISAIVLTLLWLPFADCFWASALQTFSRNCVTERINTNGCVVDTSSLIKERLKAGGRVVAAVGVVQEGKRSIGRVVEPSDVEEKRGSAGGRILVCSVEHKRGSAKCRVEVACSKALERKPANCRVPLPGGETKEGLLPFGRVESGIASVRWWDNCLRYC